MDEFKIQLGKLKTIYTTYARTITWGISGLIVVICLIFLYNIFLSTVSDARVLKILNKQVALEVVDIEMWREINTNIKFKKEPLATKNLSRNPFEQIIENP